MGKEDITMKLSAPKNATFCVALILIVIGLVAKFGVIPAIAGFAFWFVFAGALLLCLAVMLKGL